MTNFLQERKSVRDFKDKGLSLSDLEVVREAIREVDEEEGINGVHFSIFENGAIISDRLQGKAGYSGVMIKAPHYVSLELDNKEDRTELAGGYALEKVNTKLISKGLGTCWITVDQVDIQTKKDIFGTVGEKVSYIIAIGYPVGKKLFTPEATSGRKDLQEMVFIDNMENPADAESLENLGLLDIFSSIRFAPSHKNTQPWRFLLKNTKVILLMEHGEDDTRSLMDMGVIMYYFEEMAKTIGLKNKWSVLKEEDMGNYGVIAEYQL